MKIKVDGGTAKHGENLCATCQFMSAFEGISGHKVTKCSEFKVRLREPIVKCTGHLPTNHVSLWDMRHMAWIVKPVKPKAGFHSSTVTFTPYKKLNEEDRDEIDEIDG